MAVPDLPQELYNAGREYLAQLRSLGLRPEGLFWVYYVPEQRFTLQLIWSGIDRHGPLSLSKLLFKAYRRAALTRNIDPMVVEARSPKEQMAAVFLKNISEARGRADSKYMRYDWKSAFDIDPESEGETLYEWDNEWIYHIQMKPRSVHEVRKDWRQFKSRVDALAA